MEVTILDIVIEICIDGTFIAKGDVFNETEAYLLVKSFTERYLKVFGLKEATDRKKITIRPESMDGEVVDAILFENETAENLITRKTETAKDIAYFMHDIELAALSRQAVS